MDVIGFVSEHSPALDARARFEAIVERTEPSLRRAPVSAYGLEAGRDANAEALAWAWEHLDQLDGMENPGGYAWRTALRAGATRCAAQLSPRQRATVLLVDGWGYTLEATAEILGCGVSAVRNHRRRAQLRLRDALGVDHDR